MFENQDISLDFLTQKNTRSFHCGCFDFDINKD